MTNSPRTPFAAPNARRLMIFGHPSHELALFGILQRYPPVRIVIITDGGGPDRVEQSKAGMKSIGLLDRTRFLNYSENSFYTHLLDRTVAPFLAVVKTLRENIGETNPDQIYCDAIEFYNPVHDITLPMMQAACGGRPNPDVYEVPLVYQEDAAAEIYHIQRIPHALADRRVIRECAPPELAAKVHARDHIYHNLREQAGPEFMDLPPTHLAREEFAVARPGIPWPGSCGRALRYERRARLLQAQGQVERIITYAGHYLPVARALWPEASPLSRADTSGQCTIFAG